MYYKYVSLETSKLILKNKTLKITNPTTFNDPFDCNFPGFTKNKKFITDKIDVILKKCIKSMGIHPPKEEYKRLRDDLISDAPHFIHLMEELIEGIRDDWDEIISHYRILCLTESQDNILMWSHYADQHNGVVLGFDFSHDKAFNKIQPVKYDKDDQSINQYMDVFVSSMINHAFKNEIEGRENDLDEDLITQRFVDGLSRFFFIKKYIWSYEKEHRLVVKDVPADINYMTFKSSSLKSVTFGVKIDLKDRENYKKLALEMYPNLSFNQASKLKGQLTIECL